MLNMIILKTSPNHSKSLNLGSVDSFSSNFTIFEKNNSNHSILGATNRKSHKDVPRFSPSKDFLILTLHTLRAYLDWLLISFLTSQPNHETCSSPSKKNFKFSPFVRKLQIAKILKRCLLVGKKVLYKSPNDIPFKLSTLHAVNGWFVFRRITRMAIAQVPDQKKNKTKNGVLVYILLHIYANLWLKIQNLGGQKNQQLFDISKIATLQPSKQPISHIFKNPHQGM